MPPIPDLKWPLVYVAGAVVWTVNSTGYMLMLPVFLFVLMGAVLLVRQRLDERVQWRHDKLIWWLKKPLPEPQDTDWDAYERRVEYCLRGDPQARPVDPSKRAR
jgi:hypothetical protein